ncbi:MAG: AAA family ATPase [Janthinobacterium lividum]
MAEAEMDGASFREARLRLRLSQGALTQELNARLGRKYDKPKVSRWENGHEPVPAEIEAEMRRIAARQPADAKAIVLANQKGGVGKTTSALNLASALTELGKRVLLVDLDPQATATTGLLAQSAIDAYRQQRTIAHVILGDANLADIIIRKGEQLADGRTVPFDIVASHIELAETDGKREPGFDISVREALGPCRANYDWIVLDAPPNLGMLTWMALAAAEQVIIPVRTEPYDTMGVGLILGTINKVQRRLNPALRLTGILPTQFDKRKLVDREVLQHLISSLGPSAHLLAPVPNSAVFGHAARNGRVAVEASPTSTASVVYAELARALADGSPLPRASLSPADYATGSNDHGEPS